jgi:excinuclease ABC subunit A
VIKTADWVVDLGPEGGDGGGHIVAVGTPEDIAADAKSYTGHYLKEALQRNQRPATARGAQRKRA